LWHDIGKIDTTFQEWVEKKRTKNHKDIADDGEHIDKNSGKFSWQNYPRHNELSLLLSELLFSSNTNNKEMVERVKHAIFWHHAKPLRDAKKEIKKLVDIFSKMDDFEGKYGEMVATVEALFTSINMITNEHDEELEESYELEKVNFDAIEEMLEGVGLPVYKRYSVKEKLKEYKLNIKFNAENNLARTAIVTADRIVSQLTADALEFHVQNKTLDELVEQAYIKSEVLEVPYKQRWMGL